jgi:hypothetical protein
LAVRKRETRWVGRSSEIEERAVSRGRKRLGEMRREEPVVRGCGEERGWAELGSE